MLRSRVGPALSPVYRRRPAAVKKENETETEDRNRGVKVVLHIENRPRENLILLSLVLSLSELKTENFKRPKLSLPSLRLPPALPLPLCSLPG